MGGGTKTVGGGSATGVADQFNGFLKQGLNNGSFAGPNQTSGMGATIDQLLRGRTGDPTGLQDYQTTLKQMQDTTKGGPTNATTITPQTATNPLDDPNHPFNQLMGQFSQMGLDRGIGTYSSGQKPFTAAGGDIGGVMSQIGSQANLQSLDPSISSLNSAAKQFGQGANSSFFTRTPTDVNSAYGTAIQQLLDQQNTRNIADLRARYAYSGTSQGSPAAQAESLYRSQAIPQTTAALSQVNQAEQGLDLQAAGLNSQYSLGQSQNALNALMGAGNLGATQNSLTLQNQLGNRNADIGAGNMSVANAAQQNQANVAARGQDINSAQGDRSLLLQQLGLMNSSQLAQAGLQQNAGQMGMQNNQFNAGLNFQGQSQNAQNQLTAQNLWQNLMGMQGNLGIQGGQLNLQNANSNAQNQQAMMNMLMQMYGQANQIGTPQSQTVQTPSFLGQLGSAAQGIGSLFNSFSSIGNGIGNLFGGGNNGMPGPNMGAPGYGVPSGLPRGFNPAVNPFGNGVPTVGNGSGYYNPFMNNGPQSQG